MTRTRNAWAPATGQFVRSDSGRLALVSPTGCPLRRCGARGHAGRRAPAPAIGASRAAGALVRSIGARTLQMHSSGLATVAARGKVCVVIADGRVSPLRRCAAAPDRRALRQLERHRIGKEAELVHDTRRAMPCAPLGVPCERVASPGAPRSRGPSNVTRPRGSRSTRRPASSAWSGATSNGRWTRTPTTPGWYLPDNAVVVEGLASHVAVARFDLGGSPLAATGPRDGLAVLAWARPAGQPPAFADDPGGLTRARWIWLGDVPVRMGGPGGACRGSS